MIKAANQGWVKRLIRGLLIAGIIFYGITGFGITEYHIVESATFGLLTKNLSFRIHTAPYIWLPFLVLLILHIWFSMKWKKQEGGVNTLLSNHR